MQNQNSNNLVITVSRDLNNSLGKCYDVNADGTISKKANVNLSFGLAVQKIARTHEEFAALQEEVSEDSHAAFINSVFNDIAIGEEFIILSAGEIEKRLGIPQIDRERQKGIHTLEHDGKTYKAVGRFKENVSPSAWQLLDRDIDEHTPPEYVNLTTSEWIAQIGIILPGIEKVSYVKVPSTSSRVMDQARPVSPGNSHVWIKVDNPERIEQVRSAIIPLAVLKGMTWETPRLSRTENDKVVGRSLTTIFDPSVWTPGRLVFDGKPTVGEGLTVEPLRPIIVRGERDAFDLSSVAMPNSSQIREIRSKTGLVVKADGSGVSMSLDDLALNTEIAIKDYGILTLRQIIEQGITGKVRCQTPFRDSQSWAAFLRICTDENPFIFDSGTGITHWLNEFEVDEAKLIPAYSIIKKLIPKLKEDSAAALEPDAVKALATMQQSKPAEFQRSRSALKQANKEVSLAAVDQSVKAYLSESSGAQTHHGYAKQILAEFIEGTHNPVAYHGALFVVDPDSGLWESKPVDKLIRMVAEMHDGKDHCNRSSDYRAIAEHTVSLADDDTFFAAAPDGLACSGGFYQIINDEISLVPLTPEHRQRVMLDFTPVEMPTPMFDEFMHQTFKSDREGEEQQQRLLMQEIAGGIMLGVIHKLQMAILFYDPFGRAGKGTVENIFRKLVPPEFVSAITPFKWSQDYHVATLAGKRLNVVGELPENESIPSAAFKSVIGGDLVTGRHPTHRPITFTNEAAHLFMSNHLITTRDQSEAFFARWKIVEFPNSRLQLGLPLDKDLAQRIIDKELPGIAYWALEGASRLLSNGKLSDTMAHERLMAKWRRCTNTLEEFIHEDCELSEDGTYRRSEFYRAYTSWCSDNGRKPFSKGRVKELLEHNIGLGIRLVEADGYETFKGLQEKPSARSSWSPYPKKALPNTDPK